MNARRLLLPLPAAALATLVLAGCTLEPAYQAPAAPVPPAFPVGAPYQTGAAGAQPGSVVAWKAVFQDPKLADLIALALVNNRDLRAAVANVATAHAQFETQRSQLLPTVNAQGAASYSRTPPALGGAFFPPQEYSADVGVSAYQVDLFGRLRSLSKSAFESYLATVEGRRAAQASLISEVADAYLTLAADRSLLATAVATQKSGEESLSLTQSRFDAGVASQLDVAQAQTLVQQARATAATFAVNTAQAKDALDLVLGQSAPEADLPGSLEAVAPAVVAIPAGLTSDVLLTRPDVLQAEHTLKAANAQIGAARAAFFPSISLTGQDGLESASLSNLFSGPSNAWSFGPSISVPIFAGGRNIAGLRSAKAGRDAALAAYEKAIQSAFRDVADALAAEGGTVEALDAQQALVAASADALRLSTARFQKGADTYLNVLDAQRTLFAAQQGLISIRLNRVTSFVSLYWALGGGVE